MSTVTVAALTLHHSGWIGVYDRFDSNVAASSADGTAAEPGPGVRMVADTESRFAIVGGVASFSGGKASPAWGDPRLVYSAVPHQTVRVLLAEVVPTSGIWAIGLANANEAIPTGVFLKVDGTTLQAVANTAVNGAAVTVGSVTMGSTYQIMLDVQSGNTLWWIKGGPEYPDWRNLRVDAAFNADPIYGGIWNYDYDGSQVGSDIIIDVAAINSNTKHGVFATYDQNTVDSAEVWGITDAAYDAALNGM